MIKMMTCIMIKRQCLRLSLSLHKHILQVQSHFQLSVCSQLPLKNNQAFAYLAQRGLPRRHYHANAENSGGTEDDTMESNQFCHTPVMAQEVVDIIQPQSGQVIIDMTFGAGGHSLALLQRTPDIKVYGLDRDPVSHKKAQDLAKIHPQIHPLLGRFSEIPTLLAAEGLGPQSVDAVLIDAGASSMQFDDSRRGFALSKDGPLDMRMDGGRFPEQLTAEDVVNHLDESGLYKILKKYGEEKKASKIARSIVESRYAFGRIRTTRQLASIVESAFDNGSYKRDKLMRRSHVATKTFQALRIFVNDELNELHNGLDLVHGLLRSGGLCITLTFHSLEDRIVKRQFHGIDMDAKLNMTLADHKRTHTESSLYSAKEMDSLMAKQWQPISKKALLPDDSEIDSNPRARSAKLRAAKKL